MPIETKIVTRADTPSIPLDDGDIAKTPDGLTATVHSEDDHDFDEDPKVKF